MKQQIQTISKSAFDWSIYKHWLHTVCVYNRVRLLVVSHLGWHRILWQKSSLLCDRELDCGGGGLGSVSISELWSGTTLDLRRVWKTLEHCRATTQCKLLIIWNNGVSFEIIHPEFLQLKQLTWQGRGINDMTSVQTYSGAKKYLVSHQLCKFSHLKRWGL